ncbi:anaphase-promoting complex subunit 10 isoform X1 [Motacilla alba alba]|nr:anaphase-promoting complex subunit 10 isoform X1 [Motacilla alba alba]
MHSRQETPPWSSRKALPTSSVFTHTSQKTALHRCLIAPAGRLNLLTAPQAPTWISASLKRRQNTAFLPSPRRKFPVFIGAKCRRSLSQSQATAARRGSRAASTGKPYPRPGAAAGTALPDPGWHKTRGVGDDVPRMRAVPARAVPTPAASPDPRSPGASGPGGARSSQPFSHGGTDEAAAQAAAAAAGSPAHHEERGPFPTASIAVREDMTTPNKTPPGADPKQLERTGTVREIGSQAVWSLSSCKPGFGVDQLRDDNLETYWQSDGSQPHLVNIQFRRKTTVKTLCIYADYKSDESYTPSKISVRVGNNFHNLQEIRQLELVEPSGWIHVPLTDTHKKPIRTFMIQIAVLANHQNGRDTHMRQIKVYTPVEESSIGKFPRCTTIDFMMYRSIR